MRFGVTSMTGLVAGLLSPFAAFMRTPTLQAIGGSLLLSFLVFIYITLQAMQSTPAPYVPPSGSPANLATPQVDTSMKRMLNDIYGED